MDPHGHVHAGEQLEAARVGDRDPNGDDLGDLLELGRRRGRGQGLRGPRGAAPYVVDRSGQPRVGKGVDVDVDALPDPFSSTLASTRTRVGSVATASRLPVVT